MSEGGGTGPDKEIWSGIRPVKACKRSKQNLEPASAATFTSDGTQAALTRMLRVASDPYVCSFCPPLVGLLTSACDPLIRSNQRGRTAKD